MNNHSFFIKYSMWHTFNHQAHQTEKSPPGNGW
ncbi:hypothetical protein H206_05139 [Candidatus Electrothrix aarhusensis]|uniref:Uncharacterized protein n=1 Tax=Candidatus Electrothrix aarhusensis TaxID=1859131 RepID=A0A3S3UEE5_9BACT|nr:hypothetical protein H206_05139 [Candidatus Electrothrix aarhusensis]